MENDQPRHRVRGKTSRFVVKALEQAAEAHAAEALAVARPRVKLGRFGRGEAAKYRGRKAADDNESREFWAGLGSEPSSPKASRSRKTVRKCTVVSSGGGEPTTGYKTTTTTRRKPYKPTSV